MTYFHPSSPFRALSRSFHLLCALCLALLVTACGGGGGDSGTTPSGNAPAVSVTPATATVAPGATQQLTARVTNASNAAIDWSIAEGAAGGTLSGAAANADGSFTVSYTAPNGSASQTVHVVATLRGSSGVSATSTLTVSAAPAGTITLSPTEKTVLPGAATVLTAKANGAAIGSTIQWSVQEGSAGGSLGAPVTNADGSVSVTYTAPNSGTGPFHVIAALASDPAVKATATISVGATLAAKTIYVTSRGTNSITSCSVDASGDATTCAAPTTGLAEPVGLMLTPKWAFAVNFGNYSISRCALDQTSGAITGCTDAGVRNLDQPTEMALNGSTAYILGYAGGVTRCAFDATAGSFGGCTNAGVSDLVGPVGIAIQGNMAYIVNGIDLAISACSIDPASGNLSCPSNRHYLNLGLFSPYGIAVNGTDLYIVNRGAAATATSSMVQSTITRCKLKDTGELDTASCATESGVSVPGTAAGDWYQFHRIVVKNGKAWITARNINKLVECTVGSTGALSNCKASTASPVNATALATN